MLLNEIRLDALDSLCTAAFKASSDTFCVCFTSFFVGTSTASWKVTNSFASLALPQYVSGDLSVPLYHDPHGLLCRSPVFSNRVRTLVSTKTQSGVVRFSRASLLRTEKAVCDLILRPCDGGKSPCGDMTGVSEQPQRDDGDGSHDLPCTSHPLLRVPCQTVISSINTARFHVSDWWLQINLRKGNDAQSVQPNNYNASIIAHDALFCLIVKWSNFLAQNTCCCKIP